MSNSNLDIQVYIGNSIATAYPHPAIGTPGSLIFFGRFGWLVIFPSTLMTHASAALVYRSQGYKSV